MKKVLKFLVENRIFILIVALGFGLRFLNVAQVPPSLNWDEVSHGYNAYSILKSGKDEWGVPFPTIFRAYGDYKLPVYIYLTAVSEFFFGLSPFAVRLVSLIGGVVTVIFTYLLASKLFGKSIGLWAMLLVAIEPWTFFLSRVAVEANLAITFIVMGTYFFLRGVSRPSFLGISAFFLGLSVWTYNSARIFTPLFLFALLYIYRMQLLGLVRKHTLSFFLSFVIVCLFFLPMGYQLLSSQGQARYTKVAILDEGAINSIIEQRSKSRLSPFVKRLFYNKATFFGKRFFGNYLSSFSPSFLLQKGGTNYQYNVPNTGLLYFVDAPFLLLGLLYVFKNRTKSSALLLVWILIGPIAGSLTREAPHTLRDSTSLPTPMILSAVGVSYGLTFVKGMRKRVFVYVCVLLLLGLSIQYFSVYFSRYPRDYSWSWQYGYAEAVDYAKQHYGEYDRIVVSKKYGEPHEFFLFYLQWSPEKYREDPNLIRFMQSEWYWVDRFGKIYFVNDWDIPHNKATGMNTEKGIDVPFSGHTLLITSPGNYPSVGWEKVKTILFLDGSPAFDIVVYKD